MSDTGAGALAGSLPARRAAARQSGSQVTLIHDTHFHGRFGEPDDPENIANYFGLINRIAESASNPVKVGNGDDLASSVLSSVFEGEHMIDAFDAGGLAYDTYGNHDFDMGPDVLRRRVEQGETTWVSANVLDRRTEEVFAREQGARRYVVTDVGDVALGLTGLITEEAPEITSMGENAVVRRSESALEEVVPQMREAGADAVVVLSHLTSPRARQVAEGVSGVDAIVGDHAAQVLEAPETVNDTVLSFAGDEFEFVGELTLDVADGSVADFAFTLHETAAVVEEEGLDPDSAVREVMESYLEELDERLDVVIGESRVPLETRREVVRSREANVGNFVADAMHEVTDADFALMNGGGIRTDTRYEPQEITERWVVDVLPFPNNVAALEVTGETLLAALENGVSRVEELAGRFPQVSGLRYAYNPDNPVGDRIVRATVGVDRIRSEDTYTLATNDFVSGGGDGYKMLAEAEVLLSGNEGPLLSNLVADRIERLGTIAPTTGNRISVSGRPPASMPDQ
ncbi:2',3'-cyclic-nucleotide 2'-phosphodiesterase [Halobacteriales archaeon QS_1_67_19]|nr:MAG: 2',3'-cyclic-nucleotide 2'-phosphodiesterase [Halobacteriales archaeon QS_1_67_19]